MSPSDCLTPRIFETESFINFSMVNEAGNLQPSAWLSLISSTIEQALLDLNMDVTGLIRNYNVTWIMLSAVIDIHSNPMVEETISIRTWNACQHGAFFLRQLEFCRKNGDLIAAVGVQMAVFDLATRKICLTPPIADLPDFTIILDTPPFHRSSLPECILVNKQLVMPSWLDKNGHVNNARYGDLVFDALSAEQQRSYCNLRRMELFYLSELKKGEEVWISRNDSSSQVTVIGQKGSAERPAFVARFYFKEPVLEISDSESICDIKDVS